MQEIAAQLTAHHHSEGESEAQTEERVVRPVLRILGHLYEVQPRLRVPGGTQAPDYVFYGDEPSRVANSGSILTPELLSARAYAVGDAKHWDQPLDVSLRGGDAFTNANPSYQIYNYLTYSGLSWGILTNGRRWRLYHRDTAHQLDRYYEVDLPELVASNDAEQFLYFYAFFRRAAFEPGPLSLNTILQESVAYARDVGENLKEQVYLALRHIAQGFLDYGPNDLEPQAETLRQVYDASLILLYRLLFILYAEARDLLPLRESETYREHYSLDAIKQDIADDLNRGRRLAPGHAILWPRLRQLFRMIDQGDEPLRVATFNGGLFDPDRHQFLERHVVGDMHLQAAIDQLARVDVQDRREFVDYRDLSVRHLGSIYEGLLEHRLVADASEPGWAVALRTDRRERRSSGSYYTPDEIVRYIIEQAVRPALDRAIEGKATEEEKIAAVLGVNVLDPAMGSGHFLVEATDHIARYLVGLNVAPDEERGGGETELAYWKRRVVQSCIYGADLNPLAVELAKLSLWLNTVQKGRPLSFLDHHLRVGNALIGARAEDLRGATTPATTRDKVALARQARKERQAAAAGQLSMLDMPAFQQSIQAAVGSMWEIEASPALRVEDVKAQEQAYASIREALTDKYGVLANLALAPNFGVVIPRRDYRLLADYALGRSIAAP